MNEEDFDLGSVFNQKPSLNSEGEVKKEEDVANHKLLEDEPKKEDEPKPLKKEAPIKEREKFIDEDDDDDDDEPVVKKESSKEKEIDYKAENLRLQKVIKDTQKSFHEDRKKLSAYKKAIEKMKEDMILTDEDAEVLLNHTAFEEAATQNEHVIDKYSRIWDNEIQHMRKYPSHFPNIDQYISAFQHLMNFSSIKEVEEIMTDLSNYEDDEVELTNRMLEYGRQYNEDVYSDIHESGSIRQLKSKYQEKQDELQLELDKWKRKYNKLKEKHQDYDDKPGHSIRSGSGNINPSEHDSSFDLASVFKSRRQGR